MKKTLIALVVSLALVILLYSFIDFGAILTVLARADFAALGLSLVLLVGLVFASALRLKLLGAGAGMTIAAGQAIEATFAANAINLFVPGKMGDVLKASLLAHDDTAKLGVAVGLGVWEKISDLAMLLLIAALSFALSSNVPAALVLAGGGLSGLGFLLLSRPLAFVSSRLGILKKAGPVWAQIVSSLLANPRRVLVLLGLSAAIWFGHVVQIALMMSAMGVATDLAGWIGYAALLPIAIVAGLVPLTFAGVGTRDAALVLLFGTAIGPENAAALGILFWLRYLVPGVLGLPLLPKFLRTSARHISTLRNRKS